MVATLSRLSELDHGLLLIAHLICADEQIHIEEARALQSLSEEVGSNQATKAALEAILANQPEAPPVYDLAKNVSAGQKTEILQQLLAVACLDGYLAPVEKAFVNSVAKLWDFAEEDVERIRLHAQRTQRSSSKTKEGSEIAEDDISRGAQILKGAESVLSRALVERLTKIAPQNLGRHVRRLQQEILLAGPEYDEAISNCAKVAKQDYKYAESRLKSTHKTLKLLKKDLQDVLDRLSSQVTDGEGGQSLEDVVSRLDATRKGLNDKILLELEHIRSVLKSKHRSLNHFTIAFMGKTKAGKSTLHATVTGEGWEGIGVGMQRTTRYNRVYEWKNIRIIDTPGIGAPGGESDEAIAKSVVDESDVICYVVTDDSIQESEFEFMKVLKDRTKPLIVLLNIKKNLKDSRRLEHFLKNPDKLFQTGNNGIDGHINRIRRYAQEHYSNGYLDVVPVMLLAAQFARQEKDKKRASKLLEASRIKDFLDSLRMAIIDYGAIRRSQTLLGSTVYSIEEPLIWIKEQAEAYHQQAEIISSQRDRLKKEFDEALNDIQSDLKIKLQSVFAELGQSLDSFAAENWERSSEDIQNAWKEKLKQYELNKRLESAVQEAQLELENRTKETLEEIGTELELLSNFKTTTTGFKTEGQRFFEKHKEKIAFGAAVIGLAAFLPPLAPFAFVIGGVGTILGIFASTLKSKSKRQCEAVSSIRNQLAEQLSANEKKVLEQTQKQIEKCSETISTSVDDYFRQLSDGLSQIADCLHNAEADLSASVSTLNKAYASRILLWATGKSRPVSRVQRDFGKKMQIWPASSSAKDSLQKSTEELSRILQETIVIH